MVFTYVLNKTLFETPITFFEYNTKKQTYIKLFCVQIIAPAV